jgi:hypothetical protein
MVEICRFSTMAASPHAMTDLVDISQPNACNLRFPQNATSVSSLGTR